MFGREETGESSSRWLHLTTFKLFLSPGFFEQLHNLASASILRKHECRPALRVVHIDVGASLEQSDDDFTMAPKRCLHQGGVSRLILGLRRGSCRQENSHNIGMALGCRTHQGGLTPIMSRIYLGTCLQSSPHDL